MRVSTTMFFRQGTAVLQEGQSNLIETQLQLARGERLLGAEDDPVAASRLVQLQSTAAQIEQYQRNGVMARNRLGAQEQSLKDVQNVLFRIRDLAVQANNDTLDEASRGFIAAEVEETLEQLVQLANSRDADGSYLFSGFKALTEPFARTTTGVRYDGDQGQRNIQISETRRVPDGDSGDAIFMAILTGDGQLTVRANPANTGTGQLGSRSINDLAVWDADNYTVRFTAPDTYDIVDGGGAVIGTSTYVEGDAIDVQGASFVLTGAPEAGDEFAVEPSRRQSMFDTVQNFIDAMGNNTSLSGQTRLNNEMGNVLEDLDQSIENVLDFRTRVGTRLQTIDAQEVSNTDFALTIATATSQLKDLDYAEAVTRLNRQIVGLEAAQQSFARIQSLSLFNLI